MEWDGMKWDGMEKKGEMNRNGKINFLLLAPGMIIVLLFYMFLKYYKKVKGIVYPIFCHIFNTYHSRKHKYK